MIQLNVIDAAEEKSLTRIYHRAMELWCSHVSAEGAVGSAGVYANRSLSGVAEANCVLGPVGDGQTQEVAAYFERAGTRPLAWYLAGGGGTVQGLRRGNLELWRLAEEARDLPQTNPELTIIPARASFGHAREIAAAMRPGVDPQQAGEAMMCHLDDSHVDAVLGLHGGKVVGVASVLSTGEAGFVTELFVREESRGRGFASALAGRVLDICARSLFRQVACAVDSADVRAARFCQRVGFVPGEVVEIGQ